ncbi:TROVE domain-containing protein [Embleya scabrispora]|uniref:TROVE domain-containing protein n=1 Tax=Embleya scabrispora TaxID=159449 RepID=UPI000363A3DC|nr:TROVE domain-containing protein [Embleya scabrispora]MYS79082.1 TROVE domain-containing protein [Streptomyces sp. SID5474]
MSRFNLRGARPATASPIRSTGEKTVNHQGGTGYTRDARSELFLLAVTNFVGNDTFYESGGARDDRFTQLVQELAVYDGEWLLGLLTWLRRDANMRTAAIVGAAEMTRARLEFGLPGLSRQAVDAVLRRADEPGELLAYWTSRYGRNVPKPIKRGIEDAVRRLYTPQALLKYDTATKGYRFGDVLNLIHPRPAPEKPWQGALFGYALDRRHHPDTATPPASDPMLTARAELMAVPVADRAALLRAPDAGERLRAAGITWEALAGWLQGPMDAAAWSAVIPSMGYMALLRNLRNFDEAGVDDVLAGQVAARLADPEEVLRARQLPFRFVSAYRAAPSLRWSQPLELALGHALANIPKLPGHTLILVDTSSSMDSGFSRDGTLRRWDAAALFGIALGRRCGYADVVSFSSARRTWNDPSGARTKAFPLGRGESLLRSLERWRHDGFFLGGGTDTALALRQEYRAHDRVLIVTDEQNNHDAQAITASLPESTPLYTWNLAGYHTGHTPSGAHNRHTFGGLTDAAFTMVPLLEAGRDAAWPWGSTAS